MDIYIVTYTKIGPNVIFTLNHNDPEKTIPIAELAFDFSKAEKRDVLSFYSQLGDRTGRHARLIFSDYSCICCNGYDVTFCTPTSTIRIDTGTVPEVFEEVFGDIILEFYDMSDDEVHEYLNR